MAIIIKGIDMPKDIDELRLIINGMSIAIEQTEVIQIPKGARLIDANKLMEEVNIEINEYMLTEKGIRSLIRNAPTILESEEE